MSRKMSDYIKREDAINATFLGSYDKRQFDNLKVLIGNVSPADVVEVVRCKDCVYCPCEMMPYSYDFDFCSYGERAEE